MTESVQDKFPHGLLRRELFLGLVCGVAAHQARVNLSKAEEPSGSHFESARYGRGEVGELVLVDGQQNLILGRLTAVQVPDGDRKSIGQHSMKAATLDATGFIQFLGTVRTDTLQVSAGVAHYPRLGDRVYAAPHPFVGDIPVLMNQDAGEKEPISLHVGSVSGSSAAPVKLRPEKLFGRHCAVLGTTGGGKSWTVARLIGEASEHSSKIILLDATGEYRSLCGPQVMHHHLGSPHARYTATDSVQTGVPPETFQESDFLALFQPSGKAQGPKLQDAIRSLRLVRLRPDLANEDGCLKKHKQVKKPIIDAQTVFAEKLEDTSSPFDVSLLARQISHECVYPEKGNDAKSWGDWSQELTWCVSLRTRISAIMSSRAFEPVFGKQESDSLNDVLAEFLGNPAKRVLRLCLGGVSFEFNARQFIANAIGRLLLTTARDGSFSDSPLITIVDEAHNFLGRSIGYDDGEVRLDAFELIAREGRKYGLNLCLATQRPRDLTEGVLSQIGTLIVHRLTNDRDREIVERACGEVDRSATAFLANLRQGEAAIIGVDFPIPLTIQVGIPTVPPLSDGPSYQAAWSKRATS